MALANYSDLKTAVGNWLNRSDLTTYIPDFISLAESKFFSELRITAMEATLNVTISNGVAAQPTDYLEMKYAYIDGSPTSPLERKPAGWILEYYQTRSADGKPQFYASDGGNFIFGPYPDSNYTVKGTYYKQLSSLASTTTNWIMTNYPGLYLFGALLEAEPFLKNDARAVTWQAKYDEIKSLIKTADKRERYSGSPLSITASKY